MRPNKRNGFNLESLEELQTARIALGYAAMIANNAPGHEKSAKIFGQLGQAVDNRIADHEHLGFDPTIGFVDAISADFVRTALEICSTEHPDEPIKQSATNMLAQFVLSDIA